MLFAPIRTNNIMNLTIYNCLSFIFGWLLLMGPSHDHTLSSDKDWEFKKEKEGIRIYTRTPVGQNLKELKITLSVEASLTTIAAAIRDVPKMTDWVYKCSHAEMLESINEKESIEYYQVDFPWPMTDRDLVVKSTMFQDTITGALHSITESYNDFKSEQKGMVRITQHRNSWLFKPVSPTRVDIIYHLSADPAGSIPEWLVNLVVDQGPVQSMRAFRKLLQEDTYRNAQIAGIKNY